MVGTGTIGIRRVSAGGCSAARLITNAAEVASTTSGCLPARRPGGAVGPGPPAGRKPEGAWPSWIGRSQRQLRRPLPTVRAAKLSRPRAARLHTAIREVLARAVAKGGSTLRDFSSASGENGYFQLEAMVYGREGQPCRVCGTPIKALRQGQRATFFCPQCQKP